MNFELDEEQREILQALGSLLERYAGPERAIDLSQEGGYDFALDRALAESGFDGAMDAETGAGALEATLSVEAVARAGGVTSLAADALVGRGVMGRALPGPVALGSGDPSTPVRFGAHARTALWLDADAVRLLAIEPGDAEAVPSSFGYPMGRIGRRAFEAGELLPPGSAAKLRRWWRLALAAETVGTMAAALEQTVTHLKDRRQFGRPIASFQAVQHRLATCAVRVEGSRWLVYEAAYRRTSDERTACAAAHASESARQIFRETHQLSGAIGFTREHDLHVWSMRLRALGSELSGVAGHRRALAAARWGVESAVDERPQVT
jgi:alkylation response protein AidB-like acyl-CoA dehydrogenase